jgi:hypothetical protein
MGIGSEGEGFLLLNNKIGCKKRNGETLKVVESHLSKRM